jgi:hypothetical protein
MQGMPVDYSSCGPNPNDRRGSWALPGDALVRAGARRATGTQESSRPPSYVIAPCRVFFTVDDAHVVHVVHIRRGAKRPQTPEA